MSSLPSNNRRICLECGIEVPANATECRMCHCTLLPVTTVADQPPVLIAGLVEAPTKVLPSAGKAKFQFSLASIMLIITLVAVILGAWRMDPRLGIVLAILAIPALIFTCIIASRRRACGQPFSIAKKIGVFAAWLCSGAIIVLGACIITYCTYMALYARGSDPDSLVGLEASGFALFCGGPIGLIISVVISVVFIKFFKTKL
jgi:hypothetical protein